MENQTKLNLEAYLVKEFEASRIRPQTNTKTFNLIAAVLLGVAITGGLMLGRVDISEMAPMARLRKMDITFSMKEKQPEPIKKKELKKKAAPKPIKHASLEKEIKAADKLTEKKIVTRKVYGVRKVYSRGLGSGFGGGDAVVAKLGNSLDVAPDTVKATEKDLQGELVSVTKITRMPKIMKSVKPEYTTEMKTNNITGKVKAQVLVDVDGIAKQIIILKDLGFGTRQASIKAIQQMKFSPGVKGNQNVAVWIPLTFRFELQV